MAYRNYALNGNQHRPPLAACSPRVDVALEKHHLEPAPLADTSDQASAGCILTRATQSRPARSIILAQVQGTQRVGTHRQVITLPDREAAATTPIQPFYRHSKTTGLWGAKGIGSLESCIKNNRPMMRPVRPRGVYFPGTIRAARRACAPVASCAGGRATTAGPLAMISGNSARRQHRPTWAA
jgi:hypothetical protein